jgi:C1A family cysteine protease
MGEKLLASLLVMLLVGSAFGVAIPSIAHELTNTPQIEVPTNEMQDLQQRIYEQGYTYTVAENVITRLSPAEREALCGYRPLRRTAEPLPENMEFHVMVEQSSAELLGEALVEALPAAYDAMALGYVTPVKNQGGCGSCWIFATLADFESDLRRTENQTFDFSEQEVGDCNIWSSLGGYDFCEGGYDLMAINHLTNYGAAGESCHLYAGRLRTCLDCPALKSVNNWRMITGSYGESQITQIKNAIMNYGPVYTTMYAGHSGFHAYNGGVYEYWGLGEPNHAVAIIGWNDSLTHTHGTGAWLIKNSWGTSWGAQGPYPGCAWVAYGAANLGDGTSAITGYSNSQETVLYHDECGWMGYVIGCGEPTAYAAVRFVPQRAITVTAVEFWAIDDNMAYEIRLYDQMTAHPEYYQFSNQLGSTLTGTTKEAGYYSVPLLSPLTVEAGDDFIVWIKLTTTRYGYPIPIDYYTDPDLPPWTAIATFSGESYGSCDGLNFTKPYNSNSGEYYDVGIRARVTLQNQPPAATIVAITPNPAEQVFDTVSFLGNGTDPDGTVSAYNWSSSLDGPLSTAQSFTKPASELSLGVHTIAFRVQDDQGAWSAETTCNLTIAPANLTRVLDTGPGTYPSIAGRHTGTITLNRSMLVHRLFTYPSPGTGGRAISVQIGNATWNVTASGHDYSSDWQNITFNAPLILRGNETYNYTLATDSYPQLITGRTMITVSGGTMTCTEFVDANGQRHEDWIPAIRLE